MTIIRTRQFMKKAEKLPKHARTALIGRLRLFMNEPLHPLLNNHPLRGPKRAFRSINITGDYRLIYEELKEGIARLIDIDTHHNLYGS